MKKMQDRICLGEGIPNLTSNRKNIGLYEAEKFGRMVKLKIPTTLKIPRINGLIYRLVLERVGTQTKQTCKSNLDQVEKALRTFYDGACSNCKRTIDTYFSKETEEK